MKKFFIVLLLMAAFAFSQVNGVIEVENLNCDRQGYSIVRVWGTHYEMGYALGQLYASDIVTAIEEARELAPSLGASWEMLLMHVSTYEVKPDYLTEEFRGIAEGVNDATSRDFTSTEVLALNIVGDLAYLCRSVSSWGETVSDPEFSTISTRRLDYSDMGFSIVYHHVITCMSPTDGGPDIALFGWPGYVSCVTGINEYGTLVSLHDWNSGTGDSPLGALPRCLASRWALSMPTENDIENHLEMVYDSLSSYDCATGTFLNYYVPDGYGGVIKTSRLAGYFDYRIPQLECYGGEAIYTNNSDIDGSYVGEPWYHYYDENAADGNITMEGQWDAAGTSFHRVTLGYRDEGDMLFWFDGVQPGGSYTSRTENEWTDLFDRADITEKTHTPKKFKMKTGPNPFNSVVNIDLEKPAQIIITDSQGKTVYQSKALLDNYSWSAEGMPSGVYNIRAVSGDDIINSKVVYVR